MQWIKRNWVLVAFVALNIAIAVPAQAGVRNGTCDGPNGPENCCVSCWMFCGCDYVE